MRILCLLPVYHPAAQFGGFVSCTHNLNRALVEQGHEVEVYTTNAGNAKVPINQQVIVDGVKVTYFSYFAFFDFLTSIGWHFSPKMAQEIKKQLPKFDYVIINVIWNYPTLVAAKWCRKYRIPYIIEPHGALYPYAMHKKYWKKVVYFNLFVRNILKRASAIFYTTHDELLKTHHYLGLKNRAVIVPNGLHLAEFNNLPIKSDLIDSYPQLKNKRIVLYLGRMHQKKGLDLLIKAFAQLTKEEKNIFLLIVGNDEGGYIRKVHRWIKAENITDKVLFTGLLIGREKLAAYCGSDVFVLPSYNENFGMTVVEAMACGVPVVISDQVGLYEEVKRGKAGIITKCNVQSIVTGIKSVLDNHTRSHDLSIRGKNMVKRYYDIRTVATKFVAELEKTKKK